MGLGRDHSHGSEERGTPWEVAGVGIENSSLAPWNCLLFSCLPSPQDLISICCFEAVSRGSQDEGIPVGHFKNAWSLGVTGPTALVIKEVQMKITI